VSCTLPPPGEPVTKAVLLQVPATAFACTGAYRIDPADTNLHILVYRGGPMARLGHNHVIGSSSVKGNVWCGDSLASSGFDITVPVNTLIVDDNDARAAEGEDFAQNVWEEAKIGTKANMLRENLLDGARFPYINIRSVSVQGNADAPTVIAVFHIKDQTRTVTVPVTLRATDSSLRIKGEFEIRQTDFGITPTSVALGALLVQDTIKVKFELVAKAQ
jgi:polyisoprenoid-binding protein YceI